MSGMTWSVRNGEKKKKVNRIILSEEVIAVIAVNFVSKRQSEILLVLKCVSFCWADKATDLFRWLGRIEPIYTLIACFSIHLQFEVLFGIYSIRISLPCNWTIKGEMWKKKRILCCDCATKVCGCKLLAIKDIVFDTPLPLPHESAENFRHFSWRLSTTVLYLGFASSDTQSQPLVRSEYSICIIWAYSIYTRTICAWECLSYHLFLLEYFRSWPEINPWMRWN